jgi:hypothetical protein
MEPATEEASNSQPHPVSPHPSERIQLVVYCDENSYVEYCYVEYSYSRYMQLLLTRVLLLQVFDIDGVDIVENGPLRHCWGTTKYKACASFQTLE